MKAKTGNREDSRSVRCQAEIGDETLEINCRAITPQVMVYRPDPDSHVMARAMRRASAPSRR
jgi:hypothetical protein